MQDKRIHSEDRRHETNESTGSIREINGDLEIAEDHRKVPDRRINNIRAEWIDEVVIG